MSAKRAPGIEARRAGEFTGELLARARAWVPAWDGAGEGDFGHALLAIAARFDAEVAERLDRGGEKMALGLLDWLAVRGRAARPARMPVVFRMADQAPAPVLARAPVRLQADAGGAAVVFETEADVRIAPGRLEMIVAVDADADAYYLQPPGLSSLEPLEPLLVQWQLKSFAGQGAATLQLDPPLGLSADMILDIAGREYRVVKVDKDIASIAPPLEADAAAEATVRKVSTFTPYDHARNRQDHALYLGHAELLDMASAGVIEVVGAQALADGVTWEYWGKVGDGAPGWQPLTYAPADRQLADAAVLLKVQAGAVEQTSVGGVSSRWLRARKTVLSEAAGPLLQVEALGLRVNCPRGRTACPPAEHAAAAPVAEAMANTTPLTLTGVFYPLGREPRQFDAFYLGCAEAFSKKDAAVQLCFELGDPTFAALTAVRGGVFANTVLAGVGKDRALHLLAFTPSGGAISRFRDRDALRPPLPADAGASPAQPSPLNLQPRCRPAIATLGNDFFVVVAAGGQVWVWHEHAGDEKAGGWLTLGGLPDRPDSPAQIEDIVVLLVGGFPQLAVLGNCSLWVQSGGAWQQQRTRTATDQPVTLAALTPVYVEAAGALSAGPFMIGVSADRRLYRVAQDGLCDALPIVFPGNVEGLVDAGAVPQGGACPVGGIRPAAVLRESGRLLVVAASESRDELFAFLSVTNGTAVDSVARVPLEGAAKAIGGAIEVGLDGASLEFAATARKNEQETFVASWLPFDAAAPSIAFASSAPPDGGLMGGAPLMLPGHLVVPGVRGDAFVTTRDAAGRRLLQVGLEEGVVLPDTGAPYAGGDVVSVVLASTDRALATITEDYAAAGEVLYVVDTPFGAVAGEPDLLAFRRSAPGYAGTISAVDTLELDVSDVETAIDAVLLIAVAGAQELYVVQDIDDTVSPPVATLMPDLPQNAGAAEYWAPTASTARIAPVVRLDPATNGDWDAAILDHASLYFADATPAVQHARAYDVAPGNRPKVLALGEPWTVPPTAPVELVVDDAYGTWQHLLADSSSNPELSWEYWNGKGWWKLDITVDETLHLKTTGAVRFNVPSDLAASDWAGKTNYWIRARLIGGDYGQERVVVKSTPLPGGGTEQTVTRTTENIHAPSVVGLHVSYGVCNTVVPTYVLAEDAGTVRDESAANRAPGAIVEAFVPLATALGRLDAAAIPAPPDQTAPCQTACDGASSVTDRAAAASPAVAARPATGRALYLGFDAKLADEQINVLFLVADERAYDQYAPLHVEVLVGARLEPIVAFDTTRGLGESGVLTMNYPVAPTAAELFGRTLKWVRVAPAQQAPGGWSPSLRGVYFNAVWASAAETMTREPVGSSTGAPNLTLQLARPPVLQDSLELRVREPLSDEERAAMRDRDPTLVVSEAENLPGHWVRWTQVVDPADCGPRDRVYALDEETGVIRFGDSLHGAIPPIGRDAIVAFSYRRTEPPPAGSDAVPGNAVAARTSLNLVTPVESVEAATAGDDAAGGAPPEPVERVVQFGGARLRHRGRALSAADFEDIALEALPDLAQARCLVHLVEGEPRVVLIAVMRGPDPLPGRAVQRELRRLLLEAAPATLAVADALRVQAPVLRRLRIGLTLQVDAIEHSGTLADYVKRAVRAYFDPATGGPDGGGWRLGAAPGEDDIAYCLLDAPALAGIERIALMVLDDAGAAMPASIVWRERELAWLDDDAIRIDLVIPASAT